MNYAKLDYDGSRSYGDGLPPEDYQGIATSTFFKAIYDIKNGAFSVPSAEDVKLNEEAISFPEKVGTNGYYSSSIISLVDTSTNEELSTDEPIQQQGTFEVTYYYNGGNLYSGVGFTLNVKYTFSLVKNQLPLKKWTITDVICRACDLIEPLRYGEKPRFRLDGVNYDENGNVTGYTQDSIAYKLNQIISPEFAFTKMTFREQMKMIGGYIHGEMRITEPHFDENKVWFSFTFDKYGSTEKSWISNRSPISITCRTDIFSCYFFINCYLFLRHILPFP